MIRKLKEQNEQLEDWIEEKWALDVLRSANPEEETVPAEMVAALLSGQNPVKVWRNYRGLTQADLAKACGTSTAYISQLETGHRKAGRDLIAKLAKALDVDVDDLD